jgi:hypothetical protein
MGRQVGGLSGIHLTERKKANTTTELGLKHFKIVMMAKLWPLSAFQPLLADYHRDHTKVSHGCHFWGFE